MTHRPSNASAPTPKVGRGPRAPPIRQRARARSAGTQLVTDRPAATTSCLQNATPLQSNSLWMQDISRLRDATTVTHYRQTLAIPVDPVTEAASCDQIPSERRQANLYPPPSRAPLQPDRCRTRPTARALQSVIGRAAPDPRTTERHTYRGQRAGGLADWRPGGLAATFVEQARPSARVPTTESSPTRS